jgi:hypothetical protein
MSGKEDLFEPQSVLFEKDGFSIVLGTYKDTAGLGLKRDEDDCSMNSDWLVLPEDLNIPIVQMLWKDAGADKEEMLDALDILRSIKNRVPKDIS